MTTFQPGSMRFRLPFAVMAAFLLSLPALPVEAQDPLTASLLKRIGEAVDGYRGGELVWVVVEDEYPHHVWGDLHLTEEAANAALVVALERSSAYNVHGPYRSERDVPAHEDAEFNLDQLLIMLGPASREDECGPWNPDHVYPTECDPRARVTPLNRVNRTMPFHSMDSVRVQVWWGGNQYQQFSSAAKIDAFFLTVSAMDKFYFPYIARMSGMRRALQMRQALIDRLSSAVVDTVPPPPGR